MTLEPSGVCRSLRQVYKDGDNCEMPTIHGRFGDGLDCSLGA